MSDYGIKVSQTGINVGTATDAQLAYSSKFNLLKVFAQGSMDLTVGTATTLVTGTVPHNLGYRPAFLVFGVADKTNGKRYSVPFNNTLSVGGDSYSAKADSNNLYLMARINGAGAGYPASFTSTFYYYIFYDKGGA